MSDPTWPEQRPQRQDSLNDQLDDLHRVAARLGMYDAADWLWKARAAQREALSGVPGGGEPQPGTDDSGPERARQMIDEVTAEHARTWPKPPAWAVQRIDVPVRPVAVGDQPDIPCPTCKGRGWITWGPHFDGFHEVPCPACTDQENPDGR